MGVYGGMFLTHHAQFGGVYFGHTLFSSILRLFACSCLSLVRFCVRTIVVFCGFNFLRRLNVTDLI